MNLGTVIVLLVLLAMVGAVLYKLRKDKKTGKSSCGCDCSHCGGACCHQHSKS